MESNGENRHNATVSALVVLDKAGEPMEKSMKMTHSMVIQTTSKPTDVCAA